MIKSAMQLKAKIRNVSGGDSKVAMTMMRIFFMERFLERVSFSKYKEQFVLKGGMLVSSLLGIKTRATMDIDVTVQALPLKKDEIEKIITEICNIPLGDNVTFDITHIESIMDEFDYPGIRVHMEGKLDRLKQPIKIDISTDDAITPRTVDYGYHLMFEDRQIELQSYNVETLLAEKTQTILERGLANTRMRDFYDIYEITLNREYSREIYKAAFEATCRKRKTEFESNQIQDTLDSISESIKMKDMWNQFKKKNYFVEDIAYEDTVEVVKVLLT